MAGAHLPMPGFRAPRSSYAVAGIFSASVHGVLAVGALVWGRQSRFDEPLVGIRDRPRVHVLAYIALVAPASTAATRDPASLASSSRRSSISRPSVPRQRRRPERRQEPDAAPPRSPAVATPAERPPPPDSMVQVRELAPGDVASTAGAQPTPPEYAGDVDSAQPDLTAGSPEGPDGNSAALSGDAEGTNSVADLIGPVATACPTLRRLYGGPDEVMVSIGFEVDVEGAVDSATMHVVQSPARPLDERQQYAHRYSVSTRDKVDRALRALAPAYDSVVTEDVRQHVAGLRFQPALRNGRPIRSSVLISCHWP